MDIRQLGAWLLIALAVLVGVAFFFVRIDREAIRERVHSSPGMALYRFPVFRYGAATICFVLALLAYFTLLR